MEKELRTALNELTGFLQLHYSIDIADPVSKFIVDTWKKGKKPYTLLVYGCRATGKTTLLNIVKKFSAPGTVVIDDYMGEIGIGKNDRFQFVVVQVGICVVQTHILPEKYRIDPETNNVIKAKPGEYKLDMGEIEKLFQSSTKYSETSINVPKRRS